MVNKFILVILPGFFFTALNFSLYAQSDRLQYPTVLKNSFTGVSIGYINYPFSNEQIETGFKAASVSVPHAAVRITLFGHEFNKYVSAQVTYMRPVDWVLYKNVNGDQTEHSVWMNIAGLSARFQTPAWKKLSLYGEAGITLITRHGFEIDNKPVKKNANYGTVLLGIGLQYKLHQNWQLLLNAVYSPANSKEKQPHTIFYAAGFMYTMRTLSEEKIKKNASAGYSFSKNLVQLGVTTNALGYGVNNAVSKGPVPIFWGGDVQVRRGISLNFQHSIFHSKKVFSWEWGANISYWQSRKNKNDFVTVSLFPLLRFTAFRSKTTDIYFEYSVAGPTFISRTITDGSNTGKRFTFEDFMGMGTFMGPHKKLNAEIKIMHYSNGNLFPENVGYMIPLTFNIGYSF